MVLVSKRNLAIWMASSTERQYSGPTGVGVDPSRKSRSPAWLTTPALASYEVCLSRGLNWAHAYAPPSPKRRLDPSGEINSKIHGGPLARLKSSEWRSSFERTGLPVSHFQSEADLSNNKNVFASLIFWFRQTRCSCHSGARLLTLRQLATC